MELIEFILIVIGVAISVFFLRWVGGWMFRITDLIKVQQEILIQLKGLNDHHLAEMRANRLKEKQKNSTK